MYRKFDIRDYQNGGKTPYIKKVSRKEHDSSFDFEGTTSFTRRLNNAPWRVERFIKNSIAGNPNANYPEILKKFYQHRDKANHNLDNAVLFYSGDGKREVIQPIIDEKGNLAVTLNNQTFSLPNGYDKIPPYVALSDEANRTVGVANQDALAHELGHFLYTDQPDDNGYSQGVVNKYMRPKNEVTEHDRQLSEVQSDIHSIRTYLSKKKLYDEDKGMYKGKSGKFDSEMTEEMFEKAKHTSPAKRMKYIFNNNMEGILEMFNTFTHNNSKSIKYDKANYQV